MGLVVWTTNCSRTSEWDAFPELVAHPKSFPPDRPVTPPSTPLAPLLAQHQPERVALVEPIEGATRVGVGEPLRVRFNRPMVDGTRVGLDLDDAPIQFTPPVRGSVRWTSRSTLSFQAAAGTWSATRVVIMRLPPTLRSPSGESLDPESGTRTVVFDASPRFVRSESERRLAVGAPARLLFEGVAVGASLASQMLVYEVGGGGRALPFALLPKPRDEDGRTPIEVELRRALEPGALFAIALSPLLTDSGEYPRVLPFELQPRPRVEGIGCPRDTESADACQHQQAPNAVVDIGDTLVLLTSTPLSELPAGAVQVIPPLRDQKVTLDGGRRVLLSGEWEPDQVYEVRVGALRDAEGVQLKATPPLAVRSQGRTPEVRVETGRWTYERDAPAVIPFQAVHTDGGVVRVARVPEGRELMHVLDLDARFSLSRKGSWTERPMSPLVPTSKPNRWGAGRLTWRGAADGPLTNMAFVSLVPKASEKEPESVSTVFVQRTDVGLNARSMHGGVFAWLTSLSSARPLSNARIEVADTDGGKLAEGVTDARGVAWLPMAKHAAKDTVLLRATHGNDRAVMVLDASHALGPGHFGLDYGGASAETGSTVASLFTDRGFCRPGETMHVKVIARRRDGEVLRPMTKGTLRVSVKSAMREAPLLDKPLRPGARGTVDVDFVVPEDAPLGQHVVTVSAPGIDEPIGQTTFQVGEAERPAFLVDLAQEGTDVLDGQTVRASMKANYPFGAPASGRRARWTLTRRAGGWSYEARWRDYLFGPANGVSRAGTLATGELVLDDDGRGTVEARATSSASLRESASLEVTVQDVTGREASARTTWRVRPSDVEVGLRRMPGWIAHDVPVRIEAFAIDGDGEPRAGQRIEAHVVRESWYRYWEWSSVGDRQPSAAAGAYQSRNVRRQGIVHRCALTSGNEPASCEWKPERPGGYVVEVEVRDAEGRTSMASQRVYVAGPDEHPDRDPPGTAITLSPDREEYAVGDRVKLAFESPFPDAEAIVTVERDTVFHIERRRVRAGGNVVELPVTKVMAPNAFVSVALARPRTGPPGAKLDLDAPDLRLGMSEIRVKPPQAPLQVALEPQDAVIRAGTSAQIAVRLTDEGGRPVRGEVTLYAVDEGTLRLTGYLTPNPVEGLFPRRGPELAWEGLRRNLVSRVEQPLPPAVGGGGSNAPSASDRELRDRFEPTPLWLPALETDNDGRARATLTLPPRAAEYRLMAVGTDAGERTGSAETKLVATRTLVARGALPRFVVEGDRFEAALIVRNNSDADVDVDLAAEVEGKAQAPRRVRLARGNEERMAVRVDAPKAESVHVRLVARGGGDEAIVDRKIPVEARGRWVRAQTLGAVREAHEMEVTLPGGGDVRGEGIALSIASHPFVGLGVTVDELTTESYGGLESAASSLVALSAYAGLRDGLQESALDRKELAARAQRYVGELLALQHESGGFSAYNRETWPDSNPSVIALYALESARQRGWPVGEAERSRAIAFLEERARGSAFLDADPDGGRNDLAFALRVLSMCGARDEERIDALYDQRENLSPFGLAQLALAMSPSDRRRETLVQAATRRVLANRTTERSEPGVLRWGGDSTRTLGAVLEAACSIEDNRDRARDLATALLGTRTGPGLAAWSVVDTSYALSGLTAYASTFDAGRTARVEASLDGVRLTPSEDTRGGRSFFLPPDRVRNGVHRLRIESPGMTFFALQGAWLAPLGADDTVARGRELAVHRVLESATGTKLAEPGHARVGELVRVRLFVVAENGPPRGLSLRDPLSGGLEPVDDALESTPRASLEALLGMGPDDDVMDPGGVLAEQSLSTIAQRSFGGNAVVWQLGSLGAGFYEYTYAARAVVPGTYVLRPAELRSPSAPELEARSAFSTLVVER